MEATENSPQTVPSPAKRLLKNLLIDKRFQLQWMFKVAVGTSVIVAVMGFFLYRTVSLATDQMLVDTMGNLALTKEAIDAFQRQAVEDKQWTLISLVGGLAGLVLLLAGLTLLSTHKIAGPAYKLNKIFDAIDGDNLQLKAKLRKADELQNVFIGFDDLVRRLREGRRQDIEQLELLSKAIPQNASEALAQLNDILERYRNSINME